MCASFRWVSQTNPNPFDITENAQFTDFPDDISETIEEAFVNNVPELIIRTGYRINLVENLQIRVDDSFRQRPIFRRCLIDAETNILPTISSLVENKRLAQRYGFNLEPDSTDLDTYHQGSMFIMSWVMKISPKKLKISSKEIFPLLIEGIEKELGEDSDARPNSLVNNLGKVTKDRSIRGNKTYLKELSQTCVKYYTKNSALYNIINQTLRDNDESKVDALGPICFLMYDYIGKQAFQSRFFSGPIYQIINRKDTKSLVVYRGDRISKEKLDRYRQAVGNAKNCFKWLCFVSTSREELIALTFAKNVFYHIDLSRYKSNDQYADISELSVYPSEKEILLRPGVRFRVDQIEVRNATDLTHVHIHILPSYIAS